MAPCSISRGNHEDSSPLFAVSKNYIKETLSLQEHHWKSGIPRMDQASKSYIFTDEFIRERNGSKVNPMANDSPNVNRTRL